MGSPPPPAGLQHHRPQLLGTTFCPPPWEGRARKRSQPGHRQGHHFTRLPRSLTRGAEGDPKRQGLTRPGGITPTRSCGTQLVLGLGQVPTPLTWPPGQNCPAPASYPHSPLARGHKISLEAQVPGINVVDPTETVTATEREQMRTELCTAAPRLREPSISPPPQRPQDPSGWRGAVLALAACHSITRQLRAAPEG